MILGIESSVYGGYAYISGLAVVDNREFTVHNISKSKAIPVTGRGGL
jgi:hypothetical protein